MDNLGYTIQETIPRTYVAPGNRVVNGYQVWFLVHAVGEVMTVDVPNIKEDTTHNAIIELVKDSS